jgi:regulator of RNase E activity RraA
MSEIDADAEAGLLNRLAGVSSTSLADASKATSSLRMLPRELQPVRAGLKLFGRAITADASEGLMSVIAALKLAGQRDVLVVRGSDQGAVSGELFATEAQRRGVTGLIIDGNCRDRATLAKLDMPVYARGSVPNAPGAGALPVVQVQLTIDSVIVNPGDLLVGDADGIVVGSAQEFAAVIDAAETIETFESSLRDAIGGGSPLFDHINYDEHLAALAAGRDTKLNFS